MLPNPDVQTFISPSRSPKKWIIAGLILVLGVILFIAYPRVLPWLKNFTSPDAAHESSQSPVASADKYITLSCPLSKDYCLKFQLIPYPDSFYQGVGISLPVNTPLLAPFSGTYSMYLQNDEQTKQRFFLLRVKSENDKYSAVYFFGTDQNLSREQQAKLQKEQKIERGRQIATVSSGLVPIYKKDKYNLVFYVYKGEEDTPTSRIPLEPGDLLQDINLDTFKAVVK